MENTDAILLRRTRFGDTSYIITWFTLTHGKITTAARGVQRPKSPLAGKLDLFFECELQFTHSKKSAVHSLREVALRNPREALRRDYLVVQLAAYFCELLELVTEAEHPAPELFDLLRRALNHLEISPATLRALLHFEAELAKMLGVHGQAGVTPAVAIGRAYHQLPSTRASLLKTLAARKAETGS
jgi:DNA repair protein RecO (recombination protein O)